MVHSEKDDDEIITEDKEEFPKDFTLGMFVIVEYEEELFPGKVLKIIGNSITGTCMGSSRKLVNMQVSAWCQEMM